MSSMKETKECCVGEVFQRQGRTSNNVFSDNTLFVARLAYYASLLVFHR